MSPEEMNDKLIRLLSDRDERDAQRATREEKRYQAERRWNNAKVFLIGLLFVVPVLSYSVLTAQFLQQRKAEHVAVVELHGQIQNDQAVTRIVQAMQDGMENKHSKGLIIDINTPGGSPAQSERMRLKLDELAKKYPNKPIECVGSDLIASGGYLVASGCQKITVLPTTLTGSIGVIHQSFGLKHVAEKLNVDVRTITAGENKAFLNEFSELDPKHKAFVQALIGKLHQEFIGYVRRGRGDRLKETPETFSGYIWSGQDALAMGLVDQIGTIDQVIEKDFGGVDVRYYGRQNALDVLRNMQASASDVLGFMAARTSGGFSLQ